MSLTVIILKNIKWHQEEIRRINNNYITEILKLHEANKTYEKCLNSLPFGNPLKKYKVCSRYGHRIDPFTKESSFHYGIDLSCTKKDTVFSSGSGFVTKTGLKKGYGKCVIINHPLDYQSLYGHLSKILVKRGQYVRKNYPIGIAGKTGRSTAVHLHYEIRQKSSKIDPEPFLLYNK